MLVKTATSQVACTQQQSQSLMETQAETNSKLPDIEQETPVVDIDEQLATFIQHYLDMLYKSKTSVAYFAKAHVPRLRAGLTAQGDDGKERLADFLAGMILSSSTFDKKHKNLWPEKAKDILPSAALRSPESQDKNTSVKKVRKKRAKVKPDKTGCLVDEEEHFTYWWLHDDDMPASNETIESRYKRRSLGLRTREAFLQVIIMLELASLQMSVPGRPGGADATGTEGKSSKSSKSKDYTMALELLVDKLCIWHSIDNGLLVTPDADGKESQPKKAPDQLRSFCVEVIVPFYMSKAPDVASNINKKLGGPVAPSPSKRRSATTTDSSNRLSRTEREPLQRVPSERQSQKRRATPSLARSATDSQLVPGLKREPSEISLDSIPLKAEVKADSRRSSLLDKMRLRQREVDFDAMSQVQESKRKKQAEVENKLKEAISALKKPNRVLAGRELADVAEQRELMAQAREKASKAQRARQRQQIQVESTPKRNRQRTDLITATPQAKHSTDNRQQHSTSTVSMIPSSGIRVSDELESENSILDTGHRPRHLQIDATPVQGIKKFALPALPQSAIKQPVFGSASTSNVMETPVKKGVGGGGAQEIESGS
ncbi:hypothetical protein B9Z65_2802 [Elsinoe australis]|uniref:DNA replication regulator Sld3 C-terminal domain-containing protein n=1 Tax=Elsinoe australis TaxID=40998 RepID=A0A2P8A4L5_9PEZI|nr:hypothetical protein B9Z65_2802 [Elsinoe australis]